jgi:hypothetical protein
MKTALDKLTYQDRITVLKTPFDTNKIVSEQTKNYNFKPNGIWFAPKTEWIEWYNENTPEFLGNYYYKIKISGNILKISSIEELIKFSEKYKSIDCSIYGLIDWNKVAKEYDGIEIVPYIYQARLTHLWYYGWDVASGCVWDRGAVGIIEEIKL